MRRETSTVVALVGLVDGADEPLLAALARSPNVTVARAQGDGEPRAGWEPGARAMRDAARHRSTYVIVAGDPLAEVAARWRSMWDLAAGPDAAGGFELAAADALAAWRAKRFDLPDYYLVLAAAQAGDAVPDLYTGPLRAARPRRVALAVTGTAASGTVAASAGAGGTGVSGRVVSGPVVSGPVVSGAAGGVTPGAGAAGTGPAVTAVRVVNALRSLGQGPWWPPLDDLLDTARRFYPGALGSASHGTGSDR